MKTLILTLLLISASALAGGSSANVANVFQFGGGINTSIPSAIIPNPNISNLLQFSAGAASSGGGNAYLLVVKWGANTGNYAVTGGKTLYYTGIYTWCGSASCLVNFGYADAAPVANATGTVPTNAVYWSAGVDKTGLTTGATGGKWDYFPISGAVPSGKFPFVEAITSANQFNIMIQGVEL